MCPEVLPIDNYARRRRVIDAAYSWLHTPYHHHARVKGAGVDCVWLLIEVYKSVGVIPADFDPGFYSTEWYFHRHEEIYLGGVEHYAHRVMQGEWGDVALYKFGHCVSHGAIIVGDDMLIHADRRMGEVQLVEARSIADKFHSYWSPFT